MSNIGKIIFVNHKKNSVMNNLVNKVQLIGRLGGAPEVKIFGDNKKVAKFSLATTVMYYNKEGEKITDTDWHKIVCWNKNAETVEKYLNKGSQIALEGKLTYNTWEDKNGVKRTSAEIMMNEFMMIGAK